MQLYKSDADIVIIGPCLASCAVYLFLSGREKIIDHFGYIGFGGGPLSADEIRERFDRDSVQRYLFAATKDYETFFEMVGVRQAIASQRPDDNSLLIGCLEQAFCMWTWRAEDFERFGVTGVNIVRENYPEGWSNRIQLEETE